MHHVTRHCVTLTEIETLLYQATRFFRDKRDAAGDYVAVGTEHGLPLSTS